MMRFDAKDKLCYDVEYMLVVVDGDLLGKYNKVELDMLCTQFRLKGIVHCLLIVIFGS